MSSFLCFLCHSTINSDTLEEIREKYREIIGINLCPDSHLCYICCHMVNKLWLFKSVCLKRSLEYPVLFSEKGTINLQRNDTEKFILCPKDNCQEHYNNQYYFRYNYNSNDNNSHSADSNEYVKLEDEREKDAFDDYLNETDVTETNDIQNEVSVTNQYEDHGFNDNHLPELSYNDNDLFDFELSKDDQNCNDDYKSISDEGLKVGDDIVNEGNKDETVLPDKKKSKSKKNKKRGFEKIVLSLEEQKSNLERQRKSKKYIEAEFKCYNCALGFLFKDTYQAHMMRHEESNGEHRCGACSLRFAHPAVLRAHVATHSHRFKCVRCGLILRVRQRHTHARRCHRKETDSAACHLCGNVFQDASGLQQHLKRFHLSKTSNRSYPCSVCGKTYNNQAAVRTHMIKHIYRKFSCDKCDSTFSSPYTLNRHKKKHSQTEIEPQHYCTMCGVGYSSRKSLLAHKRNALNHQQRAFECPVCSRACPNQRALTSHVNTVHSTTKDFACPYCPARYTSRKSLVRHIGSHNRKIQPKIATCHLCGNHFKGNSKLNRHLREVCEKEKLEEELSSYYEQQNVM